MRFTSLTAVALLVGSSAFAQSRVSLPAGSVVIVRTMASLESSTAKVGQTFLTTVDENVGVDEYTVIPSGSKIRGSVTVATPATRQQSGVIEVVFDQLVLADGSIVPIEGRLTSTDTAERRQIKANANARVVFVGARGGIGAAIAGAGSQKSANNILAALGGMLSEGRDVSVPAGTPLAVEMVRAVSLRRGGRMRGGDASTIYTAADRISAAQRALAAQNYYRGSVNGTLDDATRRALFAFQIDRGLSGTGNLDGRTAQALGLNLTTGLAGAMLTAEDASAVRRNAQDLVTRYRTELAASAVGRLDPARAYSQADMDAWFAISAFADNASVYEQIVRSGSNRDAAVLAGKALSAAARRVDAALQNVRPSPTAQAIWTAVRRLMSPIETQPGG